MMDKFKLYKKMLEKRNQKPVLADSILSKPGVKKISNKAISYTERHRGTWFRPEYNLDEIQVAQDTDSFLFRALKRKTNRFLVSGWEITSENKEVSKYINRRIKEIEYLSKKPWNILMTETAHDLLRFSNCMWAKVRNQYASSGKTRITLNGSKTVEPVAGYFILPFETLVFKTKRNGDIKKVKQETPSGEWKEFFPEDLIHFYDNRKPGFAMGTPETLTVLDDIALLRRLEENIESLVESNLYPLFHYQVGSDAFPERYSPEGLKETDIVKRTIEYMPAGGVYVSDHRHKISAIGSQGKALEIEQYLKYFKQRIFTGLGVSGVDMGEGDTANRSTANALSKAAIQDVEALQKTLKTFIEFYVFNELLLEGGYDPLEEENKVEIRFGVVDLENKTKIENQAIQLFTNNVVSQTEARVKLGLKPEIKEEESYFSLYTFPLAELKAPQPKGPQNLSESISKPENQFGKLAGPRLGKDFIKTIFNQIDYTVENLTKSKNYVIDSREKNLLKIKNKISFLEKLELLLEEEYNCNVQKKIEPKIFSNIATDFLKDLKI